MKKGFSHVFVWAYVLVTIFPIYWVVSTALKSEELATRIPPVFLFVPTIETFKSLFLDNDLVSYLINSLIVTSSAIIISIIVGTLAGYSLARYRTGGKSLTLSIMIAQMIPPMVITFPLYIFIQKLGLIDTRTGLVIAQLSLTIPFTIWVMRQFFMQIPKEVEEAAKIDGASVLQVLFRIILPMSKTGLVTVIIFDFIGSWNEFLYPLTLTISEARTVTIAASNFVTTYNILWTRIDAVTTIIMIPTIIITVLMRRHIVSGLIGDSNKG